MGNSQSPPVLKNDKENVNHHPRPQDLYRNGSGGSSSSTSNGPALKRPWSHDGEMAPEGRSTVATEETKNKRAHLTSMPSSTYHVQSQTSSTTQSPGMLNGIPSAMDKALPPPPPSVLSLSSSHPPSLPSLPPSDPDPPVQALPFAPPPTIHHPALDPSDLDILNDKDFLAAFLDDGTSPPPPIQEAPCVGPTAPAPPLSPPATCPTKLGGPDLIEISCPPSTAAVAAPMVPPMVEESAIPPPITPQVPSIAIEEDDFDSEWAAAAISLAEAHERQQQQQEQAPFSSYDHQAGNASLPQQAAAPSFQGPAPSAHVGDKPNTCPSNPVPAPSSSSSSYPRPPRSRAMAPQQIKSIIAGGRGYDTRKKRWCYTSITGERFDGAAANARMKEDEAILARGQDFDSIRASLVSSSSTQASSDDSSLQDLSHWVPALPVVDAYRAKGISKLFEWQVACLQQVSGSDKGGCHSTTAASSGHSTPAPQNLVYSAPTSGGKTLVAEILLLQALIRRGGTALFVQPYIALVEEKARHFRQVWKELQISVEALHGESGSFLDDEPDVEVRRWAKRTVSINLHETSISPEILVDAVVAFKQRRSHVVVSTIERANAQVNRLLERGAGDRLSFVVVDELHMVGGKDRGYLIELMLAKLRKAAPHVQIVGMSATLINLPEIARWLGAHLYTCNHRPVRLSHYLCEEGKLRRHDPSKPGRWQALGPVNCSARLRQAERNPQRQVLLHLCEQTAAQRKGVLVFCASKSWTVSLAQSLAQNLILTPPEGLSRRAEVCLRLQQTAVGLEDTLGFTVPRGVAYHNADLTLEERDIIEQAFRDGDILVLVATSTLAAGVNLPAARVIIRSPAIGNQELDVTRFRQMCGRAGRLGLDTEGEAFLMLDSPKDRALGETLITKELPPITSELESAVGGGIERAILEVVTARVAKSPAQVVAFADYTLLHAQCQPHEPHKVHTYFDKALEKLIHTKFLEVRRLRKALPPPPAQGGAPAQPVGPQEEEEEVVCTQLGQATFFSSLSPSEALVVLQSLERARKKLILTSDLHAVFLVTPTAGLSLARNEYQELIKKLAITTCQEVCEVIRAVGILPDYLYRVSQGRAPDPSGRAQGELCQRFIAALALFNFIQPTPIPQVDAMLSGLIPPGKMQRLQADAETMCGMVVCFCRHLKWDALATLLATFQDRLAFGVPEQHVALMKLGAGLMHRARAKLLYQRGLKTLEDLASTDGSELARVLTDSRPYGEGTQGAKSIRRLSEAIIHRAKKVILKGVGGGAGIGERRRDDGGHGGSFAS